MVRGGVVGIHSYRGLSCLPRARTEHGRHVPHPNEVRGLRGVIAGLRHAGNAWRCTTTMESVRGMCEDREYIMEMLMKFSVDVPNVHREYQLRRGDR